MKPDNGFMYTVNYLKKSGIFFIKKINQTLKKIYLYTLSPRTDLI